jgi:hypothetical protein
MRYFDERTNDCEFGSSKQKRSSMSKKTLADTRRGNASPEEHRERMIETAVALGKEMGVSQACRTLSVPRSSVYWARRPKVQPAPRPTPDRALSDEENAGATRQEIAETLRVAYHLTGVGCLYTASRALGDLVKEP